MIVSKILFLYRHLHSVERNLILLLCSCSRRSFILLTVSSELLTLFCSIGSSCSMSVSLPFVSQAGLFFNFGRPLPLLVAPDLFSIASFSTLGFLALVAFKDRRLATETGLAIALFGLAVVLGLLACSLLL